MISSSMYYCDEEGEQLKLGLTNGAEESYNTTHTVGKKSKATIYRE